MFKQRVAGVSARVKSEERVRTCAGGSPSTPARSQRGRTADASRAPRAPGVRSLASATCTRTFHTSPYNLRLGYPYKQCSPLSALITCMLSLLSTSSTQHERSMSVAVTVADAVAVAWRVAGGAWHSSSAIHLIERGPTQAEFAAED